MLEASPRVRIVTGKGGVGKSVMAASLGLALAKAGHRVLVAETHGRDRIAALLGAEPVGAHMREVLERLYVVDMNLEDGIHEYALLFLRFESLYKAVFENRWIKRFLRMIPSLAELVMLGKIWFHEQELDGDRPRFDTIVLDAPSTGHCLSLLRAPAVVEATIPPGPLREIARRLRTMLTDPDRTRLQIVATAEEMPINEAIELAVAANDTLQMALSPLILNNVTAPLPPEAWSFLEQLPNDPTLAPMLALLQSRRDRAQAGQAQLERLPTHLSRGAIEIPRLAVERFGRAQLDQIAQLLAPSLRPEGTP